MNESYYPPRLSGFFILLLSSVILISSIILVYFKPFASPTSQQKTSPTPYARLTSSPSPTPVPKTNTVSTCKIGGCSSELCLEIGSPDRASICLYRNEYACLKYSVCEKQPNGNCGWTQTSQYLSCLKNLSQQTPPSF
jgi:hypothetical protein